MKQRVKSAPVRPRTAKDMVHGANMKVKDLFSPAKNGDQQFPLAPTTKPVSKVLCFSLTETYKYLFWFTVMIVHLQQFFIFKRLVGHI